MTVDWTAGEWKDFRISETSTKANSDGSFCWSEWQACSWPEHTDLDVYEYRWLSARFAQGKYLRMLSKSDQAATQE